MGRVTVAVSVFSPSTIFLQVLRSFLVHVATGRCWYDLAVYLIFSKSRKKTLKKKLLYVLAPGLLLVFALGSRNTCSTVWR